MARRAISDLGDAADGTGVASTCFALAFFAMVRSSQS
jgi:hypothetical protein